MSGIRKTRESLVALFGAGFVVGIILLNLGKKSMMSEGGFLSEEMLYHMKYMTVNNNAFLWYVLAGRLKNVLFMAIMATTYLGLVFVYGATAWYGMTAGMFVSLAILRYGLKGILLVLAGVFPQYLLYIPAYYLLFLWCRKICRGIYFEKNLVLEDRQALLMIFLKLAGIIGAIVVGVLLESYVNPIVFSALLKIF